MTPRNSLGQFLKGTHFRPHQTFREREYLVNEYCVKKRSTGDIASDHNVTASAIRHWMRVHQISRRNVSECRKLKFWRTTPVTRPATREEQTEYRRLMWLAFPEQKARAVDRAKRWQQANPAKYQALQKNRVRNPEERKRAFRKYDQKRKPQRAAYVRKRRREDVNFRIRCNLTSRVIQALRKNKKTHKTIKLLGCSIDSFKIYLESRWQPGMTWENYGRYPGWQIDHEMPCAIFDLTKPEHQKRCFHFSNCQPMWAAKNCEKNAKVLTNQFNLL